MLYSRLFFTSFCLFICLSGCNFPICPYLWLIVYLSRSFLINQLIVCHGRFVHFNSIRTDHFLTLFQYLLLYFFSLKVLILSIAYLYLRIVVVLYCKLLSVFLSVHRFVCFSNSLFFLFVCVLQYFLIC